MSVGLVIPTLNAEKELSALLDIIYAQTRVPDDILVVDSSSEDGTLQVAAAYPGVRTTTIERRNFDHGGTRQLALESVQGEFVLFLTQDSIPINENYVEHILLPFHNPNVGMASGRQLPKQDAKRYVQLVQEFNYPAVSNKRTREDIGRLGIKAFFASDACSAYRRSAIEKVGGIPNPCSTNEDMLACARLLRAGFSAVYVADACVQHSHNLTFSEQYRRNRAIGQFLAEHASELDVPSEVGEGVELVKKVFKSLLSEKRVIECARFASDCAARLLGNRIGRRFG